MPHLNMIGNQPAISSHCNGKLIISTGWLAGHEVQFKYATENQRQIHDTGLLIKKFYQQNTLQMTDK